jgi:hypothetical protein
VELAHPTGQIPGPVFGGIERDLGYLVCHEGGNVLAFPVEASPGAELLSEAGESTTVIRLPS